MDTVNVLEIIDGTPLSIRSFPDTKAGNKKAEKLFTAAILENGCKKVNIEYYIEEGYWERRDSFMTSYGAYIIHSS